MGAAQCGDGEDGRDVVHVPAAEATHSGSAGPAEDDGAGAHERDERAPAPRRRDDRARIATRRRLLRRRRGRRARGLRLRGVLHSAARGEQRGRDQAE